MSSNCSNLNSGLTENTNKPYLGQTHTNLTPVFGNTDQMKEVPIYGGNYSRSKYDVGSHEIDTRQSTLAVEYMLDPTYAERCAGQCRPAAPGWIGKQGVSYNTQIPLIDTESELKNLNRVLTRDPNYKYLPYCPNCGECNDSTPCGQGVSKGCENCQPKMYHFNACGNRDEYTRLSNPICTLKETGVNRFDPICMNPQDENRWLQPSEIGINSRMIFKDNSVPCVPIPLDQFLALPPGGTIPCQLTTPTCGNYNQSMHSLQN